MHAAQRFLCPPWTADGAHLRRELPQGGDAVFRRRVGGEQVVHARPRQRIDDEQVRRRGIFLGRNVLDLTGGGVDLRQRGGQRLRVAADVRARLISRVLAG